MIKPGLDLFKWISFVSYKIIKRTFVSGGLIYNKLNTGLIAGIAKVKVKEQYISAIKCIFLIGPGGCDGAEEKHSTQSQAEQSNT
jgi:hypothetical protein